MESRATDVVRDADSAFRARTLLIIEDEAQIRRAVRNALQDLAERIVEAETGAAGVDLAASEQPDLIVLDLGMPDMSGVDVCREIRGWATMPIVVLSARHAEQEKVLLLNAGADDYVTKPFSTLEFAARVRAQLRRARAARAGAESPELVLGDLVIDLARRTARRGETSIRLTPTEWSILRTLSSHPGRTLTHQQIYDAVWARPFGNPQQYLRVYVTNLRRKIEVDPARPALIITDPGVGYRFEPTPRP
ncbi:MAG TPA: response regulator transcription factor [Gemmatimonadales bacterium]|nr:response regulator transcription factor [Gemmatimonadales bacterium]